MDPQSKERIPIHSQKTNNESIPHLLRRKEKPRKGAVTEAIFLGIHWFLVTCLKCAFFWNGRVMLCASRFQKPQHFSRQDLCLPCDEVFACIPWHIIPIYILLSGLITAIITTATHQSEEMPPGECGKSLLQELELVPLMPLNLSCFHLL